jgi:hypothetical protein
MKRIIRLTESDLTNIVKRVIEETKIVKRNNGDIMMGSDSFFTGSRPSEDYDPMYGLAEIQLKSVILMMSHLPEKITSEEKEYYTTLYNSQIKNALQCVRNNEEQVNELIPIVKKSY